MRGVRMSVWQQISFVGNVISEAAIILIRISEITSAVLVIAMVARIMMMVSTVVA